MTSTTSSNSDCGRRCSGAGGWRGPVVGTLDWQGRSLGVESKAEEIELASAELRPISLADAVVESVLSHSESRSAVALGELMAAIRVGARSAVESPGADANEFSTNKDERSMSPIQRGKGKQVVLKEMEYCGCEGKVGAMLRYE